MFGRVILPGPEPRRNGDDYEQTEICKKHFKNGK